MSDTILKIIPTNHVWQPSQVQDEAAKSVLKSLVEAAKIESIFSNTTEFIDQGSNFESLSCLLCHSNLEVSWWQDEMSKHHDSDAGFDDLSIVTPCCMAQSSLNELRYQWPAGFARYQIVAENPGDAKWLSNEECNQISQALGQPVKQIIAHS